MKGSRQQIAEKEMQVSLMFIASKNIEMADIVAKAFKKYKILLHIQ